MSGRVFLLALLIAGAVRDSQNSFTCIVNRDHPLNLKPTCYDAEGTATILQGPQGFMIMTPSEPMADGPKEKK